jgi:adhesin transport system membrane fusion protein
MMRHRESMVIIGLSSLAVIAFLIWSIWAELDQITRARGQVIPSGRVQIVQAATDGVITRILVRDGQRVERGQLLVALDRVKAGAAVDDGRARVAGLRAALARIEAELSGGALVPSPDLAAYPEVVENQRLLLTRRRQALAADLGALSAQLALARQELELNRPLVGSGDVARAELIRLERQVTDLRGQIASRRSRYLEELQAEQVRVREELASAEQALTQRADDLGNAELRAPVSGLVSNLKVATVGGVVRAGEEIMQIVPDRAALIIEARLSPAEIAFIRPGQSASVKFDAYDSSVYGGAEGRVTFVNPDTTTGQAANGAQESYYRVQLTADPRTMRPHRPGEKIVIQPGMTATAEIRTGETTVFRYLTKPILKTTAESMTER